METTTPPSAPNVGEDYVSTISSMSVDCLCDDDYKPEDRTLHLLSQGELNYLILDLNLSKRKAEILGSRMQQWNLLRSNTRISKNVKMISLLFSKYKTVLCIATTLKD